MFHYLLWPIACLLFFSCSLQIHHSERANRQIASEDECLRDGDYCKLREMFKKARAPSHKNLRIKKKWLCCDDLEFSENCTTRKFFHVKEYGKNSRRYQVFEQFSKDTTSVSHISDTEIKSSIRFGSYNSLYYAMPLYIESYRILDGHLLVEDSAQITHEWQRDELTSWQRAIESGGRDRMVNYYKVCKED